MSKPRYTASTITDDVLDDLYERLRKAEQEADATVTAAAHLTTLVGKRAEKAERAAEKQRRRADIAENELRILRAGLRANGADPTQIQNLWAQIRLRNRQWREAKQRADRAEAAIARAEAFAHELRHKDAVRLLAAFDEPKEH
jgi:hypothetical protein